MTERLEVSGMTVERGAVSLGEFTFECGESVPELTVAYETYGEFDADSAEPRSAGDRTESGNNVVLVCHALTGSAHVAGRRDDADAQVIGDNEYGPDRTGGQARAWWDDIVGPGKAIDTNRYYVVCVNLPGSCYGTTGPASENPETGDPYATDFPPVTVGDWTRAQREALDALGVGRLRAVVGGSVGGMNVLEWGKQYPDDVDRLVPIAAAARLDAQCLGLDAIAGRAIASDPNWQDGRYYGGDRPDRGLAMARQIGHMMYLSKASMGRKFGRRSAGRDSPGPFPAGPTARYFPYREVESYLDYNADKFVERFDANSYLYLMAAMDNYDLSSGYNTDADALAAFDGETLLMSFTADWHFTVEQAAALAEAAEAGGGGVAHHVVDSDHGHDAFLVEPEKVGPPLRDFLADGVEGRAVSDARAADAERAPVHSSLFSR